jgi:hypothetical protein
VKVVAQVPENLGVIPVGSTAHYYVALELDPSSSSITLEKQVNVPLQIVFKYIGTEVKQMVLLSIPDVEGK